MTTSDNTSSAPSAPLFLTGYMACGKTTFGRALARATGRVFIDLDFRIEQRFHTTVSRIFAEKGESGFRRLESMMLAEVAAMENVVVACGGGTPCFNGNMDLMLRSGHTVWLEASVPVIVRRLEQNRGKRPLMASKNSDEIEAAVRDGLEARLPFYSRCRIRFGGDLLEDRRQIDASVKRFVESHREIFLCDKQENS